jgi:hypothetical protein
MASNKKPSIYSDRGNFGSAEELDEYGVWVKSEPQVLSETGDIKASSIDAVGIEEVEVSFDDDKALSFDDAVLDINEIDSPITDNEGIGFSDTEFSDNLENFDIESNDEMLGAQPELEDFNAIQGDNGVESGAAIEIEDTTFEEFDSLTTEDVSSDVSSTEDITSDIENINIDDFNIEEEASEDFNIADTEETSAMHDDFSEVDEINELLNLEAAAMHDTEALTADDFAAQESSEDIPTDDFSIETAADDISADEFSIDTSDDSFTSNESEDFGVPTVKAIKNNVGIEENKDEELSAHLLLKIANELSSIRGELTDLKKEFSLVRSTGALNQAKSEDHDEHSGFFSEEDDETIALTGDELDNIISTTEQITESAEQIEDEDEAIALTGDELDNIINSTEQITETIEQEEFDNIEDETISFTDDDFSGFSSLEQDAGGETIEDEVIALTGDELDNIVNSADFTEEAGANETEDEAIDISIEFEESEEETLDIDFEDEIFSQADIPTADDLEDLDLSFTSESTAAEENDFDGFADLNMDTESLSDDLEQIEEELTKDDFADFDDLNETTGIDDTDELEMLREEGATPITHVPENISYLEEAAEEEKDSSDFDFSDAVIDEPELSADGISDDMIEPSLDETELDLNSFDDLTIDDSEMPLMEDIDKIEENLDFSDDAQMIEEDLDLIDDELLEENLDLTDEVIEDDLNLEDDLDLADDTQLLEEDIEKIEDIDSFDDIQELEEEPVSKPQVQQPVKAAPSAPVPAPAPAATAPQMMTAAQGFQAGGKEGFIIPSELKSELRNILSYMDQLLESLPEEKIEEFAKSEYFDSYKKLFKDLGLV